MKETTIDTKYDAGLDALERQGTYDDNYEAKVVQKALLSDIEYTGDASRNMGLGYTTNEYEAKVVQKAFLSDKDHYGPGESANFKKEMNIENYENASITERQEVLLFQRDPTSEGSKSFNCSISMKTPNKPACDIKAPRQLNNLDRVFQPTPEASDRTITKNRLSVDLNMGIDRIDPELLTALRNNPYARQLGSVA
jgi:hypothetical protein